MEMFRKLSSQILIDLRELEGDYRVFNLQIDKAQTVLGMIIAGIGIFSMLFMDRLIFRDSPGLVIIMLIARSCYVLVTALFVFAIGKTNMVRVFDRLVLGWLFLTVLFMLFFNFIRPVDYPPMVFNIIIIFSIYALSPLKLSQKNSINGLLPRFLRKGSKTWRNPFNPLPESVFSSPPYRD